LNETQGVLSSGNEFFVEGIKVRCISRYVDPFPAEHVANPAEHAATMPIDHVTGRQLASWDIGLRAMEAGEMSDLMGMSHTTDLTMYYEERTHEKIGSMKASHTVCTRPVFEP